jgi:hypothetical protein
VRRALPYLAALLLGVGAALTIGCGDRSNLVPGDVASDLDSRLAAAKTAIAAGQCSAARDAVEAGFADAKGLKNQVDRRLRSRINDGFRQLEKTYEQACLDARTTTATPPQTTSTETQTQTTDTTTTATDTTPTDTTPTEPSTGTPTEPSTPTPAEPSAATPPTSTDAGTGAEATP